MGPRQVRRLYRALPVSPYYRRFREATPKCIPRPALTALHRPAALWESGWECTGFHHRVAYGLQGLVYHLGLGKSSRKDEKISTKYRDTTVQYFTDTALLLMGGARVSLCEKMCRITMVLLKQCRKRSRLKEWMTMHAVLITMHIGFRMQGMVDAAFCGSSQQSAGKPMDSQKCPPAVSRGANAFGEDYLTRVR